MPIKSYPITRGETSEEFVRRLPLEDIQKNRALEVYHCLDALRIWEDAFRSEYGELLSLTHRFDGDDPPDVEAVFERGTLPMEHTCIEPENRRKAHALLPNQMRRVIPSSSKVKSVKGILNASNPLSPNAYSDVISEAHANYDLIANAMRRKMGKCPGGAVLVLESHSGLSCDWTVEPARVAFDLIRRESTWEKYTFILLARNNPVSYASAFLSAHRPFEIRRFSPPPMTEEELNAAWKEITGGDLPNCFQSKKRKINHSH